MKTILIVVPAHNEEANIGQCLTELEHLEIPEGYLAKTVVVLDRCTDQTVNITSRFKQTQMLLKNYYGDHVAHGSNNFDLALRSVPFGEIIVRCDADVQSIPRNILTTLLPHLNDEVRRVSAEVKSKSDKWYWNRLFWLSELNGKIAPLGQEPRGAFCMFERRTVNEVGGFHKRSWSWDSGFDMLIKQHGWKVMKIRNVTVVTKRHAGFHEIVKRQILSGKARKSLHISFKRTLLHSLFRGRIFVLYGYLTEKNP